MNIEGIFLHSQKNYLQSKIAGTRIDKIFQPTKLSLVLQLTNWKQAFSLYINLSNNTPHLRLIDKLPINPQTPLGFCMLMRKHLEDGRIAQITQNNLDRVLTIDIDTLGEKNCITTKQLIIELAGKNSNIILVHNGIIIDCIKHISKAMNNIRQIQPQKTYICPPIQTGLNILTNPLSNISQQLSNQTLPLSKALVQETLGIGPFTAKEISYRSGLDTNITCDKLDQKDFDAITEAIQSLVQPIKEDAYQTTACLDDSNKLLSLTTYQPQHIGKAIQKNFQDINLALDFAIKHEQIAKPANIEINQLIKNQIQKTTKKINLLQQEYTQSQNADIYKNIADNIMANLHNIEKGIKNYTCIDIFTNKQIQIQLDPLLSANQNAQKYYKSYNKQKRATSQLQNQITQSQELLNYLETIELSIQNIQTSNELLEIKAELTDLGIIKQKAKKQAKIAQSMPLKITLDSGATILIGKNNKQNDYLTFKLSRPTDIWLHTKDIPGSHVILQNQTQNDDIISAAKLAAYFSKAKDSSNVAVDYTMRKNVKKPSGSKPGFVIYDKQKTLYVMPENNLII